MTIRITYDQSGANLSRGISQSYGSLMKTMEKLSSGRRINRASDDPAGLVISENLRAKIASLNQDIKNTSLLIKKYETADSTIAELRSGLTELKNQILGASNDGFNSDSMRVAYQKAADNAISNYNGIIQSASFNGIALFDGGNGSLANLSPLEGIDLSTSESAQNSIKKIDEAMARLDTLQVDIGATQKNELEVRRSSLEVAAENLTASESQIGDTDFIEEVANMTRDKIKLKAGVALLAHSKMSRLSVLDLLE